MAQVCAGADNILPVDRALGDVMSQKIEGRKKVDFKRSLTTAGYGAVFIGVQTHAGPSVYRLMRRSFNSQCKQKAFSHWHEYMII